MAITRTKTVGATLTTSNATLYTAPVGKDVVLASIRVANIDSSSRTYKLKVNGSYIAFTTAVAVGDCHVLIENGTLFLQPGELVEGEASANSAVRVTIGVIEKTALP